MKQDTIDFLSTLLSLADNPDRGEDRPFMGKTVYDFSPAFQAGAEKFVDAFREYLESEGFGHLIRAGERSFGGNVYFSLSGHGCGFFDDNDERVSNLQDVIQEWACAPNNHAHRFEELENDIEVGKDGKIDLCIIPEAIESVRAALFAVPPPPEKRGPGGRYAPAWMDCGEGMLLDPTTRNPVCTRVVEAKGWGRIFEVYDYSDAPERNFAMILAAPQMLEALEYAAELIGVARKHFPKSMHNSDKFQLENTCATINKAIHKAKRGVQ